MKHSVKHSVKIRLISLAAALLTAAGSLCGCAGQRVPADTQTRDTEGGYAYRIDVSPYIDAIRADHPGFLTLVNKTHPVDEDFAPARLSDMDKSLTLYGKDVQLEATAALAAEALIRELWSMGWKDVKITSGYRTFTYQSQLFNTYIANEKSAHPSWTTAEAEREVLETAMDRLAEGGRLCVITFHSLEDRIVKQRFKLWSSDCICPPHLPRCVCGHKAEVRLLTKKPIVPSREELLLNPRSGSSKLRVIEKIPAHQEQHP